MVEIFTHKSDRRYFYAVLSNEITVGDVDLWVNQFVSYSKSGETYIIIQDYTDGFFVDNKSYLEIAKVSKKIKHLLSDSIFVGLKGIQLLFYRLFSKLAPNKNFNRYLYKTLFEFEKQFGVSLKKDFVKIYESN